MGDLFNSDKPDSLSVEHYKAAMRKMSDVGLPVFVIQGQHDRAVPPWPVALNDTGIQYVDRKVFMPLGAEGPAFFGMDCMGTKEEVKAALETVPASVSVVVGHQLTKSVFPMDGVWTLDDAWLPPHITHAFMGDFHDGVETSAETPKLYYSGSTYACKIDEASDKSFLDVTCDDTGLTVNRVKLVTRKFLQLSIQRIEDLNGVLATAAGLPAFELSKWGSVGVPIAVIQYLVTLGDVETQLTKAFEHKAHLWLRPTTNRVIWPGDNLEPHDATQPETLLSCLNTFAEPGSAENTFVSDLLSKPADAVFEAWRAKIM